MAIAHNWNLGLVVVFAGLPPMVSAGYLKIRSDAKLDRHNSKRFSASASIASRGSYCDPHRVLFGDREVCTGQVHGGTR